MAMGLKSNTTLALMKAKDFLFMYRCKSNSWPTTGNLFLAWTITANYKRSESVCCFNEHKRT